MKNPIKTLLKHHTSPLLHPGQPTAHIHHYLRSSTACPSLSPHRSPQPPFTFHYHHQNPLQSILTVTLRHHFSRAQYHWPVTYQLNCKIIQHHHSAPSCPNSTALTAVQPLEKKPIIHRHDTEELVTTYLSANTGSSFKLSLSFFNLDFSPGTNVPSHYSTKSKPFNIQKSVHQENKTTSSRRKPNYIPTKLLVVGRTSTVSPQQARDRCDAAPEIVADKSP